MAINQPARKELPLFPVKALKPLLALAFDEDLGSGDVTSIATLPETHSSKALLLAKEPGIMAGLPVISEVFRYKGLAPSIQYQIEEGAYFSQGDVLVILAGNTRDLLGCERILLNFLQRLCGIATVTGAFVDALKGSKTKVLDTRKTLPGWRALDKYAVAAGGGKNHRQGLYDQILIKDNHAAACGSVREAVLRARSKYGGGYVIEAEVKTLDELESLFDLPVDIVLLDNMNNELLAESVRLTQLHAPKIKLEASGNMTLERVAGLRDFGLDFISVGALTHSVKALDLSLDIK